MSTVQRRGVAAAVPGDAPLSHISEDVRGAEDALLSAARESPAHIWSQRELVDVARDAGYKSTIATIAYWRLVDSGKFELVDDDLGVRPLN